MAHLVVFEVAHFVKSGCVTSATYSSDDIQFLDIQTHVRFVKPGTFLVQKLVQHNMKNSGAAPSATARNTAAVH